MAVFVFIYIAIALVSLAALPIRIEIEMSAKIIENSGGFKIRVFGIPVYAGSFYAESKDPTHNNLILVHHEKRAEIHLSADKKDRQSVVSYLSNPLLSNLRLKYLALDVRLGVKHDPFLTTMAFGSARIVLYSVLGFIKTRFGTEITENFTPDYYSDRLDFSARAEISIRPADILYGLVLATAKAAKDKVKKEKRKTVRVVNSQG